MYSPRHMPQQGPDSLNYMPYHPHHYNNNNNNNNNPSTQMGSQNGFSFRKRFERVDWRKLAMVDVDRISRDLDFSALQENIMNITFCNIESEIDVRYVDPNFIKLFKLSQLSIEYLLHSQEYLTDTLTALEEQTNKSKDAVDKTKKLYDKQADEMNDLRKEAKKRKKIIEAQQTMINAGSNSYHKCPFCQKAFMGPNFLQDHMIRRHPNPNHATNRMEKELDDVKDRLKKAESDLEHERISTLAREQAERFRTQPIDMDSLKRDALDSQHRAIETMKDAFLRELRELTGKQNSSDDAIRAAMDRMGRENKSDPRDAETIRKQQDELDHLKELFNTKMDEMERTHRSDQQTWKDRYGDMKRKQSEELERLREELRLAQEALRADDSKKKDREYLRRIAELERRLREQEEYVQQQEQAVPLQAALPLAPSPPPPRPVISDSSDTESEDGQVEIPFTYRKSPILLNALKRDPGLLKRLKPEILALLDSNLRRRGVAPGTVTVSDEFYKRELGTLKTERQKIARANFGFYDMRHGIADEVDSLCKNQYTGKSPRPETQLSPRRKARKAKAAITAARAFSQDRSAPDRRKTTADINTSPENRSKSLSPQRHAPPTGGSNHPPPPMYPQQSQSRPIDRTPPIPAPRSNITAQPRPAASRASAPGGGGYNRILGVPQHQKPYDDEEDEDDDGESSEWDDNDVSELLAISDDRQKPLPYKSQPSRAPVGGPGRGGQGTYHPEPKGPIVGNVTKNIERQLRDGTGRKPTGGVDTLPRKKETPVQDFGSEEDSGPFSLSDLDDNTDPSHRATVKQQQQPRNNPTNQHPQPPQRPSTADSNTYGTSVWSASAPAKAGGKDNSQATNKSSLISLSDFDSDDDSMTIEELK